jgi:cytochrome c553
MFPGDPVKTHYATQTVGLALLACALSAATAADPKQADPAKGKAIVAVSCVACHGSDGNSQAPMFPKLAGQHAGYLVKQLEDFKAQRRNSQFMTPTVEALSVDDFKNLAAFFASRKPAPGVVNNPALIPAGKALYDDGNPASGLPACAGCHGDDGAGNERFPRLAGQHADYTIDQMRQYAAGQRTNGRRLMQTVAKRMTDAEARAVAEYIASLP